MKALSIRQPWAWAILNAGKDIENRAWPTNYRGPLLIHAAKQLDQEGCHRLRRAGLLSEDQALVRGGIIGHATLVDCVTEHASCWFHGPFGFVLVDPTPVEFAPMPGQRGLFHVQWPQQTP